MKLCGIDEAGRGCLAGDLVVAGCILHKKIAGLTDSKKLSEKKREQFFIQILKQSTYHIVSFSPLEIDTLGLSCCIKNALVEIIQTLDAEQYLFDGNTTFGVQNLQTMVKADAKVAEVSAASILAKVTRDNAIKASAKLYPQYNFTTHKGYGTKKHIELIKKYGYSPIHRKSYTIKSLQPTLNLY